MLMAQPTTIGSGYLTSSPPLPEERQRPTTYLAYQELPSFVSQETWDDMTKVRDALRSHEQGQFYLAADLVDRMMEDVWIGSKVSERIGALLGLPLELTPARARGTKPHRELQRQATPIFRREELWQVHFWGLWLGFGFARVRWDTRPERWTPHLEWWHPRHVLWRWDLAAYQVSAQDGVLELRPGNPDWLLHTPYGSRRGWMLGLIRRLAVLWLLKQWTLRDWSRHNEVHGNPIRKAIVPAGADDEVEKNRFLRAVANLGAESVIRIIQGETQGTSYDVQLVEPRSQAFETFGQLKDTLDTDIAIAIVGQNLTTKVEGGSHAAANVHKLIRADLLREDGAALALTCQEGLIAPYTEFNFGSADRAPLLGWPTTPPEDGQAVATKTKAFLEVVKEAAENSIPLDVAWLAKSVGVTLLEDESGRPVRARPIKDWHVQAGVVTPNEAREPLGLPPREGGDEPANAQPAPLEPPEPPVKTRALALADDEAVRGQEAVDQAAGELAAEAGQVFERWWPSLMAALKKAPEDSERAAAAWLERTSPAPLLGTTETGLIRCWLIGWAGALTRTEKLAEGSVLELATKRPHQDAIDFLRQKVPVTPSVWARLGKNARRHAFKVAAVSQVRMVADVQQALVRALRDGGTFERFEREVGPQLRRAWTQSKSRSAPKGEDAQAWRLETIYRTVTQSAYNAGRVQQLRTPAARKAMPYWLLSVVADERNCPTCSKLRRPRLVLPVDHPVWQRLIPPLHFCCRCTVVGLSAGQAKRIGIARRAPSVQAQEGFGEDPTLWPWKPDVKALPPSMQKTLKQCLKSQR
jgi:SPP1 gp7 family putative phage head morphogenesis protein